MIIPFVQPHHTRSSCWTRGMCVNTRERISARVRVESSGIPSCPLTTPLFGKKVGFFFCQTTSEGKRKNNKNPNRFQSSLCSLSKPWTCPQVPSQETLLSSFCWKQLTLQLYLCLLSDSYEMIVKNNNTSIHKGWLSPALSKPSPAHAFAGKGQPEKPEESISLKPDIQKENSLVRWKQARAGAMELHSQCTETMKQLKWLSNTTLSLISSNNTFSRINTRCFQVGVSSFCSWHTALLPGNLVNQWGCGSSAGVEKCERKRGETMVPLASCSPWNVWTGELYSFHWLGTESPHSCDDSTGQEYISGFKWVTPMGVGSQRYYFVFFRLCPEEQAKHTICC